MNTWLLALEQRDSEDVYNLKENITIENEELSFKHERS